MHIVVLSIDALQPAYLGAYGNEWIETPTIDAWAARGVVFDQHFADAPARPITGEADLLERLTAAGVTTARIGGARRGIRKTLDKLTRAKQALLWIEVDDLVPPWSLPKSVLASHFAADDDEEEPLEPFLGDLPAAIDSDDDTSFERLQRTYAAAVARLDETLAKLAGDIGWDEAIWIVTAGRGLPLGEHGPVGFPGSLFEELVHLPLIVVWPNGEHAGRRVPALTQPRDLAPTIAELFGVEMPGESVLPLLKSSHATIRPHAITTDDGAVGVRTPEWYLLKTSPAEPSQLYVKPEDRWDVNDVSKQHEDAVLESNE